MLAVQKTIQENYNFLIQKRLLLALSGGIDSMTLSHALLSLKIPFTAAHVNYQLRDTESDSDETFVYEYCQRESIRLYTLREKIDGQSSSNIQNQAREIRHTFFNQLIAEHKFDFLLIAHHQNDRVENFIMNLSRGAGLKGLTAMPQHSVHIFRPFIYLTKEDIKEYANNFSIHWREDSSNNQDYYLRNSLRLNIIPAIENLIPHFTKNTARSIQHLEKSFLLKEFYKKNWLKNHVTSQGNQIKIEIQNNPEDLFIYDILSEYGFHPKTSEEIFKNLNISGKIFESHDQWFASTDRNHILIYRKTENKIDVNPISIHKNQNLLVVENGLFKISTKNNDINDRSFQNCPTNIIQIDEEKIQYPLTLRPWIPGDYMKPFGMKGMAKKIQDILVDKKIPLSEKKDQWILCSGHEIIWLVNHCVSESVKISNKTKHILVIEFLKTDQ